MHLVEILRLKKKPLEIYEPFNVYTTQEVATRL